MQINANKKGTSSIRKKAMTKSFSMIDGLGYDFGDSGSSLENGNDGSFFADIGTGLL